MMWWRTRIEQSAAAAVARDVYLPSAIRDEEDDDAMVVELAIVVEDSLT